MSAPGSVSAEAAASLIVSGQAPIPMAASLFYSAVDPYAVRVAFHVGLDEPVEWVFARDILADGARGFEGVGDVRVWPSADTNGRLAVLNIRLSSPSGEALFRFPAADVTKFLTATHQLVPRGCEFLYLDIDAELTSLLEGGQQ
jgi:hypothetical protein